MDTLLFTPTKVRLNTEQVSKRIIQGIDNFCQYDLNRKYCTIESEYNESEIGFEIRCQMLEESTEPDENNQSTIIEKWLSINRLTFFYVGEEIEVENHDKIYEAIEKNYRS